MTDLPALRAAVQAEPHFEPAARCLLRALLDHAAQAASPFDPPVRVLRAAMHLRSGPGYRGLVLDTDEIPDALPSTTAWRWVRLGKPVAIDVLDAKVVPEGGPPRRAGMPMHIGPGTQELLRGRSASHVYAVPVFTINGAVGAMLSVEAAAPGWVQRPLELWRALRHFLDVASRPLGGLVLSKPLVTPHPVQADPFLPVIGATMEPVLDTLAKFAQLNATVLLTGDTGVGKSRIARWVHGRSRRSGGPFVAAALANEPADVAAATLFGVRAGAYTDAKADRIGLLDRAQGGTLFLDEIDALPLELQARVLTLLDERTFRRVGEPDRDRTADVRFIVATNAALEDAVEAQRFRRDLYYRLFELPVHIPALDERRDEILPWARHFLQETAGRAAVSLDASAEAALLGGSYAGGNLRELRSRVQRGFALAQTGDATVVSAEHIERGAHPDRSRTRLAAALRTAAKAWVDALLLDPEGRLDDGGLDVFRQYVRREICERVGLAEGFARLDLQGTVRGRSHTRKYREAVVAVESFETDH